jgi:hypothetical protein
LSPDISTSHKEDPRRGYEGIDKVVRTEGCSHQDKGTHTALVFKALKDSLQEHPAGPEELQSKVQGQVQSNDNNPYQDNTKIA